MNRIFVPVILFAALALGGCIETQLLVKIRTDGSGTIHETIRMKKDVGAMFQAMVMGMKEGLEEAGMEVEESDAAASSDDALSGSLLEMFNDEEIRAHAEKMGVGVRYVSHEMIDTDEHAGYQAVYAFDDINAVSVSQDPGANLPEFPGNEGEGDTQDDLVAFSFTPGSPARLVIRPPQDDEDDAAQDEAEPESDMTAEEESAEGMEQMKEFFRDMRLRVEIAVDGSIQKTNASFVDGSTVTLMDIDFNALLDNPELFKQMQHADQMGPSAVMDMMKKIPGLKVETEKEITVTFR
ncbi:MAG: hypothetical protein RBU27_05810 [Bacteroidota bacterium]|jgi:hypothetical protein|nr:hypothetical protein [Bacteroidota bacterium]